MKELKSVFADQPAFALPTVLIISLVLLVIGLSTLQISSSISRSLQDQHWQRLAKEAGQAGVVYAASCLQKNGDEYWSGSLAPDKNCKGGGVGGYVAQSTDTTPNWKSTFAVSVPNEVNGAGLRAKAIGTVQLFSASGVILKTYTSEYTVVVNTQASNTLFAKKVQTSGATTCVIASDSQAYCAGQNNFGQLGDKTTQNQVNAVKFQLPEGLTALDMLVRGTITCIVASDQQLYCAGYNAQGQLGDGTQVNATTTLAKFSLPVGVGVRAIPKHTAVSDATCVIATNERLYCAGVNDYGKFGTGATAPYYQTTPVPFCGSGCSMGDLNGSHTRIINAHVGSFGNICVVTHDVSGGVWNYPYCAGNNSSGRLGDNTTTSKSTPIIFPTGQVQVTQAYSNNGMTCAASYIVYCAGTNGSYQLIDGTNTTRMTPVQSFSGSQGAQKVYSFYSSTCATFNSTEMWCGGDNSYGKLGNGSTTTGAGYNRFGVGGKGVKDFDIDSLSICALTLSEEIYCAGYNAYGTFGNSSTANTATPVKFGLPVGISAVSGSFTNTVVCALGSDSNAYCSGNNNTGQLSDGTTSNKSTPVKFQLP